MLDCLAVRILLILCVGTPTAAETDEDEEGFKVEKGGTFSGNLVGFGVVSRVGFGRGGSCLSSSTGLPPYSISQIMIYMT